MISLYLTILVCRPLCSFICYRMGFTYHRQNLDRWFFGVYLILLLFPTLSLAIDSLHILGIETGTQREESPEKDFLHYEPVGQPQNHQQSDLQDHQQGDLQDHQQGAGRFTGSPAGQLTGQLSSWHYPNCWIDTTSDDQYLRCKCGNGFLPFTFLRLISLFLNTSSL